MSEYLQCQACKVFLTSADDLSRRKHVLGCLKANYNSNEEPLVKIENPPDSDCDWSYLNGNNFEQVVFPEAVIHLIRQRPPNDDDTDGLNVPDTVHSKRVRKRRRPTSDSQDDVEESKEEGPKTNPKNGRKPPPKSERAKGITEKQRERNKQRQRALSPSEHLIRTYKFRCDKCPAQFYSKKECDSHKNIHSGQRSLIPCLICLRIFNKRDSLNSHILAHITAEEMEERNFFDWEIKSGGPFSRLRLICKYCLLVHPSRKSFREHHQKEHDKGNNSIQFPCRMGKDHCSEQFGTIRELVEHAKAAHSKEYYGHLAWSRMTKGVYYLRPDLVKYRKNVKNGADKSGDDNDKTTPVTSSTNQENKKKSTKRKRIKKKAPSEVEDKDEPWLGEILDKECLGAPHGTKSRPNNYNYKEENVKRIEIECVNITEDGKVIIKREWREDESSHLVKVPKVEVEAKNDENEDEAIPILMAFEAKTEIF